MKCLCGYNYLEDWEIDRELDFCGTEEQRQKLKDKNEEEFIKIQGHFIYKDTSGWDDRLEEIPLYICPKCGTVKARDFR